jgi:hypothetical protein
VPPDAPRLVFLHHPRTGGTSLHESFAAAFHPDEICPERFARLHAHTPEELARWRFFSGHFRHDQFWAIAEPRLLVTVLREPRARILSLWRYWRAIDPALVAAHSLAGPRLAQALPLADFLRAEHAEVRHAIDNAMACHLAGDAMPLGGGRFGRFTDDGATPLDPAALLDRAQRMLFRYDVVGFTEDLEPVRARVAALLGRALPPLGRRNATEPADAEEPGVAAALDRLTALDAALLAHARTHRRVRRA